MIFLCPAPRPSSSSSVLWLSTNAVQPTVPIGDDGQLMSCGSCGWPVQWLSTNAVQLTVPIGDVGQLMSCGWPALWLSTNAVQLTVPMCVSDKCFSTSVFRQVFFDKCFP